MTISVQSINDFTPSAQGILREVSKSVNLRKASKAAPEDLLASIAESDTPQGNALRMYNATYGQILSCCTFHKSDFGRSLTFNETDIPANFSSEGRTILTRAAMIAEARDKDLISEDELFELVAGYNGVINTSSKILDRLGIKREFLSHAINECKVVRNKILPASSSAVLPTHVISA